MSVTTPAGFTAAGVTAGLKPSGTPDLALVLNHGPHKAAAGVFTSNRIQAAPVQWSRQVLADHGLRAVILNSGGANACTGPDGFADTHHTAEQMATALPAAGHDVGAIDVAVCSTGLIGVRLPMDKITAAIPTLVKSLAADGGPAAATAIMTTDTVVKEAVAVRDGWSVGGMAKGAAMLAPGLATMLVVITTDAVVDSGALHDQLAEATAGSFDRVDSDGCMSTNDTVLLLSSGASGVSPQPAELTAAVAAVCTRSGLAAGGRRRGSGHTTSHRRDQRGIGGRCRRGGQEHRPEQPVQVRGVRQRPQLGPRAVRRRDHRCGLRARRAGRGLQRRTDLPVRGDR